MILISSFLTLVRYYFFFFYQQLKSPKATRARLCVSTPHLGELLVEQQAFQPRQKCRLSSMKAFQIDEHSRLTTALTYLCMYHRTLHRILYVLPRVVTSLATNVHYRIKYLGRFDCTDIPRLLMKLTLDQGGVRD